MRFIDEARVSHLSSPFKITRSPVCLRVARIVYERRNVRAKLGKYSRRSNSFSPAESGLDDLLGVTPASTEFSSVSAKRSSRRRAREGRYLGVCFVDTPRDTECLHFDSFEARRDFPRSRLGRGVCLRSFASTTVGRDNWPCTLADGEVGSLIRSAEESSRCPVVGQFISHRPALLPNRSGNCFLEQWPNYRFILSTLSSVFRRFNVSSFPRRNQVSPETKKKSRDTTRHKYSPDERNFKHSTLGIISIRVEQSLRRLENQLQFPRLNKRCGAGYTYVVAF